MAGFAGGFGLEVLGEAEAAGTALGDELPGPFAEGKDAVQGVMLGEVAGGLPSSNDGRKL